MSDTNNTYTLRVANCIPQWAGTSVREYPKSYDKFVNILAYEDLNTALSELENKEATKLDLSYNDLGKFIRAKSLKKALLGLENKKVTELDLSYNDLCKYMAAENLKEALSGLENTKVTSLNLSNNGPDLVSKLLSTNTAFKNIHTLTLSNSEINSMNETQLNSFMKIFPNILTLKDENGNKFHENLIGRSKKIQNSTGEYPLFYEIQKHTGLPNELAALTMEYLDNNQIAASLKKDESSSKVKQAAMCFALLSIIHGVVLLSMILLPREILSTKIAKASDFFKNKIFVITAALFIIITISAIVAVGQSARTNKRANVTGKTKNTPTAAIPQQGNNNT